MKKLLISQELTDQLAFSRWRYHYAGESRARRDWVTSGREWGLTWFRRIGPEGTRLRRRRTTTACRRRCLQPRRPGRSSKSPWSELGLGHWVTTPLKFDSSSSSPSSPLVFSVTDRRSRLRFQSERGILVYCKKIFFSLSLVWRLWSIRTVYLADFRIEVSWVFKINGWKLWMVWRWL